MDIILISVRRGNEKEGNENVHEEEKRGKRIILVSISFFMLITVIYLNN